jgi:hypothetical protein
MPSSKDPAATQEFKISALPSEAVEDSDLIPALTKLVNEVYASAEDGFCTKGRVTLPDLPKRHQGHAQAAAQEPWPVYRNRIPWFSHVRKVKSRPDTGARPR